MQIIRPNLAAISSDAIKNCSNCKQDYRHTSSLANFHWKRKYCSPHCARAAARKRIKSTNKIWRCGQCRSLVSGKEIAMNRKYCTEKCHRHYASKDAIFKELKYKVEVIEEGNFK